MTIKELKEELSKYDENTTISFWDLEKGYYNYLFIVDDPLQNDNRVDIVLIQKESEWNNMIRIIQQIDFQQIREKLHEGTAIVTNVSLLSDQEIRLFSKVRLFDINDLTNIRKYSYKELKNIIIIINDVSLLNSFEKSLLVFYALTRYNYNNIALYINIKQMIVNTFNESEWKSMLQLEILSVSLITLIFFTFLYLSLSFLFRSKDTHENEQTNEYLTPQEKQQAIEQFLNNYGWLSPEAQQKIIKGKYVTPESLQRDLEFYNQDEYIGKFERIK